MLLYFIVLFVILSFINYLYLLSQAYEKQHNNTDKVFYRNLLLIQHALVTLTLEKSHVGNAAEPLYKYVQV